MRYTVLDRIRTNTDTTPVVVDILTDLAETSKLEPGCLEFAVSEIGDGEIHVYQSYMSQQALLAHRRTSHYREFHKKMTSLSVEVDSFEGTTLAARADRRFGQALVLGGASGIGRACALALAELGHEVVIADREATAADKAAEQFTDFGLRARSVAVDVGDPNKLAEMFTEVFRSDDSLEILVNSAGHIDQVEFGSITGNQIERMLSVHLRGTMLTTKHASDVMRRNGYGRIVNVSSVAALKGSPNHSHYAAAKAGIVGFTKSVSLDLAKTGITVNCVLPGPIRTPLLDGLSDEALETLAATPVGRIGVPEDVANAVSFLCSPKASFITGATLLVAGGSYV